MNRFLTYTKYHADETPYTVIEDTQPDPDNVLFQITRRNPVYRYPLNQARYLARKWNKQHQSQPTEPEPQSRLNELTRIADDLGLYD